MVNLFSCANPVFLLLTLAVIAINGYRHNPDDQETAILGYRFEDDPNVNSNNKRDPGQNLMWIGPRLGRRKRSDEDIALTEVEKNKGAVVEFLQDSPWAFVALKGGKRRTVNFIPRLGRDSEEEYTDNTLDTTYEKSSSRSGNQVSGPFGGSNNFTPRLGRFATFYNRDHL